MRMLAASSCRFLKRQASINRRYHASSAAGSVAMALNKERRGTEKRMVLFASMKSPSDLPQQTKEDLNLDMSTRTVHRILFNGECKDYNPKKKKLLTGAICQKRLKSAINHKHWSSKTWQKVINFLLYNSLFAIPFQMYFMYFLPMRHIFMCRDISLWLFEENKVYQSDHLTVIKLLSMPQKSCVGVASLIMNLVGSTSAKV